MADLHTAGGVPHGWRLTLPPGDPAVGRLAFIDFGCFNCHTVTDKQSPTPPAEQPNPGPDLTGMGRHHPASYFAESILNPNAVLVDGPGYLGPDGRSTMPSYPDMTLAQLVDLVAYLQSLTEGDGAQSRTRIPASGASGASSFFVQAYEVEPDQLDEFYDWFERQEFRRYEGLRSIDTYVGRDGDGRLLIAVFGFDNEVALRRFVRDATEPGSDALGTDFVRPAKRYILRSPPVYRAIGLVVP